MLLKDTKKRKKKKGKERKNGKKPNNFNATETLLEDYHLNTTSLCANKQHWK